jgi:hypothetical protein
VSLVARAERLQPHADPHDDAPRKKAEKYTGPPATIAALERQGLVGVTITCDGQNCWNSKRVTFDNLALPGDAPVRSPTRLQVPAVRLPPGAGFAGLLGQMLG